MTPAHDRLGLLLHPIDRGSSPLEKTQGGGGHLRADPVSRNERDPILRDGLEVHSASLALLSHLAGLQWLPDLRLNPLCLNFFGVRGEEPGEARSCHVFGAWRQAPGPLPGSFAEGGPRRPFAPKVLSRAQSSSCTPRAIIAMLVTP